MPLYCGIDLDSNNRFICMIDDKDKRILDVKLDNNEQMTISALSKIQKAPQGQARYSDPRYSSACDCQAIARPSKTNKISFIC